MNQALQHVAGRVWIFPPDPDPDRVQASVAVVADDGGSIVVDAGHSPALARTVQRAIRDAGLPDARTLIYTHHHWDHVWGACAWPEVEVIGHESGRLLLEQEALRPWSESYLRDSVAENPRLGPSFRARAMAMASWEGFSVRPPDRTFTDPIQLAGIEVRHVGGRHAEDSTVVGVPDSGVLLLGDCYFPPPYHLRSPTDGPDLALVRALMDDRFSWYVDSHSDPHPRDEVVALIG